jgi:hypothetical protein
MLGGWVFCGVPERSMPVHAGVKENQTATKMMVKYATVNHVRFRARALVWILLIASRGAAQTQSPDVAATELVRQTVAHELAATDAGGQYMYRVCEETPQGSETRVMVETRDLQIDRLILQNGQPLPPAQRQREEERLRSLLTNRAPLLKLQTEQRSDEARVRRVIQVLPDAFLYQHAGAEKDSAGRELVLVTFRPNPDFRPRSTELRVLQEVEGAMLIDPAADRFVRVEVRLFRDVDFGWGIFDRISRGGSLLLQQQVVWHNQWAMTTLTLHFTNRLLLLITSRVDSVTKVSDFRRMPDDLTPRQALELLLDRDPMMATVPGSGKIP